MFALLTNRIEFILLAFFAFVFCSRGKKVSIVCRTRKCEQQQNAKNKRLSKMRYTALDVAFRYADKKQKHAYVGCCVHVCAMYDVSLPGIMCVWRIVFCLSLSLSICIFNRHSTVTYRNCIESQMKEYDSRRGCVGAAVATAVGDDDNVCARFCIYLHFSFLLYWRRQWWRIGRIHTCLTTLFSFKNPMTLYI